MKFVCVSACLYVCKSLRVLLYLWGKALCNSGYIFQFLLNTRLILRNSTDTSFYKRRPWWVRFSASCDVCVNSRVVLSLMFGPVWLNRWVGGDDRIQGIPRCSFYLILLQKSHTHTHTEISQKLLLISFQHNMATLRTKTIFAMTFIRQSHATQGAITPRLIADEIIFLTSVKHMNLHLWFLKNNAEFIEYQFKKRIPK